MMTGCLRHTHEADRKKVRLSNLTKSYILDLLQQGHDIKETLAICQNEWLRDNPNRKAIAYIDVKYV